MLDGGGAVVRNCSLPLQASLLASGLSGSGLTTPDARRLYDREQKALKSKIVPSLMISVGVRGLEPSAGLEILVLSGRPEEVKGLDASKNTRSGVLCWNRDPCQYRFFKAGPSTTDEQILNGDAVHVK
jgi:hypothetical protein